MNLDKIINESVKKVLREGLYGYPDDLDQIILAFNSDGECYRVYERILMSLLKKVNRGVELDFNTLVNSSVMKKLQSMILRKFKRYQNNFTKESYYKLREYIARKMFEDIEEGNYTYDDNKILKENFQIEGSPKSLGIDIARYLFDNGIDVYEFTNQVEKEYEMMNSDKGQKKNLNFNAIKASKKQLELIKTIMNSSSSESIDDFGNCVENKRVPLTNDKDIGFAIWDDYSVDFYIFYQDKNGNWDYEWNNINDSQIPKIISMIRK